MSFDSRSQRAAGQRRTANAFRAAILAALGYAPDVIEPGKMQRFATSEWRGDDTGWCRLFDDLRGSVFGDHRAGISETWQADREQPMTHAQRVAMARQIEAATREREHQQRDQRAENATRIAKLHGELVPLVPGDPVALYLRRRGVGDVWPLPACLRLHRALPYWHDDEKIGTFPAMVAPIVASDGRTVAVHRTYLTTDGRKAAVASPKKLTAAAGSLAGACIPLQRPPHGCIGIAEAKAEARLKLRRKLDSADDGEWRSR